MAKTPLILDARQRLRLLGDQLYYVAFADSLAGVAFNAFDQEAKEQLTVDAFPGNPNARGINVRLERLPFFREAALASSYGAVVTAGYEVCESYAVQLPLLLDRLGKYPLSHDACTPPEDNLREALSSAGITIPRERYETFKYLRLRRNQIAHLRAEPTAELALFVRTRGTHLLRYWKYDGALDFSATPTRFVHKHEAIAMLRFMRIVLDDIDSEAAEHIDVGKVIPELDSDVLEAQPSLRGLDGPRRRAKKIASMLSILYDIDAEPEDVLAMMPPV